MQNVGGGVFEAAMSRVIGPEMVLLRVNASLAQIEILQEGAHALRASQTNICQEGYWIVLKMSLIWVEDRGIVSVVKHG